VASGKDIRAGGAYVALGTKDSALVAGLKKAQAKIAAFGAGIRNVSLGMAGAGTAILTPMLAATKAYVDAGSSALDMSLRTGLSVEAVQELGYAAQQSGSNVETLEGGVRKMQKAIGDAADGLKSAVDALGKLGLTVADLKDLSPEQQFEAIANRINAIADPTAKAAVAMELFGKSGTSLLPMIGDMAALRGEARRLGVVMSTEQAQAAHAVGDTLDAVKGAMRGVYTAIGGALAPTLADLGRRFAEAVAVASAFIREHQTLVTTVAGVATGLVALGTSMAAFGAVLAKVGPAVKLVGVAIGIISSPIALIATGITALAGLFAYVAIEGETMSDKLATAWAWIQGATVTATGYVQSAWQSVMEYLAPAFNWLREAATTAFAAVGFTIKNWQNELAWVMVAAAYNVVRFGNEVVYTFTEVIPGFLSWFLNNWRDIFQTAWNFVSTFATNVGNNLANLFDSIVTLFTGGGWNFEWTGLLDGFEYTIKELPKIAEREIGALEGALKGEMDALGGELAKTWEQYRKELAGKTGVGPALPVAGAAAPALAGAGRDFAYELALGGQAAQTKYSALSQFGGAGLGMTGGSSAVLDRLDRLHRDMQQLTEVTKKNKPGDARWSK